MRVLVFEFMTHAMPWMSLAEMNDLIQTLSVPVNKLRCLLCEVMTMDHA